MKERVVQWAERLIRLPVVGLDISDRSVKYVKLAGGRRTEVEFFGEAEIPEGIITEGEIKREDELASILRGLVLSERGFRSSGAAVSLPEEKSFLRLVQLPRVKPEEIAGALRWQIENQVPLPPEDVAYDYEIIEPLADHLDHLDAVIIAFPRRIIDSYVRVLREAGLQPAALELESQAIARAAIGQARSTGEAKIIVDMGRSRSSFVIFAGGAIIFTATLPVGGRLFEAEIAKALGMDAGEAMRIKKEIGLARDAYGGKLFAALLPVLEDLAAELRRAVVYYQDHVIHIHGGSERIGLILLSGGDANLYGLDTYLASQIRIPVQIADPFANLDERLEYVVPPIPRNQALAFTAAIGLAMRGK